MTQQLTARALAESPSVNMMPLIYSGWQCLTGTLHRNETMNPQVKQIRLFVITYTTILGKK